MDSDRLYAFFQTHNTNNLTLTPTGAYAHTTNNTDLVVGRLADNTLATLPLTLTSNTYCPDTGQDWFIFADGSCFGATAMGAGLYETECGITFAYDAQFQPEPILRASRY